MYITKLNWLQPEQVAEAYTLLDNLKEPISLAVSTVLLQADLYTSIYHLNARTGGIQVS